MVDVAADDAVAAVATRLRRERLLEIADVYPDSLKSRAKFLAFCGSEDSDGA
jgi:hypothetical protein